MSFVVIICVVVLFVVFCVFAFVPPPRVCVCCDKMYMCVLFVICCVMLCVCLFVCGCVCVCLLCVCFDCDLLCGGVWCCCACSLSCACLWLLCLCILFVMDGVMWYGLCVRFLFGVCVCVLLSLFNMFVRCDCDLLCDVVWFAVLLLLFGVLVWPSVVRLFRNAFV